MARKGPFPSPRSPTTKKLVMSPSVIRPPSSSADEAKEHSRIYREAEGLQGQIRGL